MRRNVLFLVKTASESNDYPTLRDSIANGEAESEERRGVGGGGRGGGGRGGGGRGRGGRGGVAYRPVAGGHGGYDIQCRVATSTYRSQPIRNTDLGESSNHITRFHHVYEGPRTFNNVTASTRFAVGILGR
ncbi:hypothetical protein F441_10373 [Phytophthora nicotianae CJ01A1]|uniref:Uncharacterized protein n=1 Tax=Phytophthora nicotianae CJ01A1 TaxID=1317063 RepID=W2WW33_PHYNI|nr:hypothetical protein F441_10373 [Phytophthora nicotianae CJ01A1]